jgi:hypothetical protein
VHLQSLPAKDKKTVFNCSQLLFLHGVLKGNHTFYVYGSVVCHRLNLKGVMTEGQDKDRECAMVGCIEHSVSRGKMRQMGTSVAYIV